MFRNNKTDLYTVLELIVLVSGELSDQICSSDPLESLPRLEYIILSYLRSR